MWDVGYKFEYMTPKRYKKKLVVIALAYTGKLQ